MLVNELHQGGIRALLAWDPDIFANMVLPEGIAAADVEDHIIYKYGDAPLFTPDPATIKFYIGRWSKRRLPLWERYKAAIEIEYNPLENYDRTELEKFTHGHTIGHTGTITDTPSGTITDSVDSTIEQQRAADNSSTFEPMDKEIDKGKTNERTYTGYKEERAFNNTDSNTGTDTKDSRIHGNIGVTTSQQMLISELDLIPRLDLIDYIAQDWHSEFCMQIYT